MHRKEASKIVGVYHDLIRAHRPCCKARSEKIGTQMSAVHSRLPIQACPLPHRRISDAKRCPFMIFQCVRLPLFKPLLSQRSSSTIQFKGRDCRPSPSSTRMLMRQLASSSRTRFAIPWRLPSFGFSSEFKINNKLDFII